mmetsp:Transcript_16430/g.35518  ORF Transcript_16430/g.35518 Transcript_16430/m.35518 type:complete len:286 (-) Transcript_16430:895-1752(-)
MRRRVLTVDEGTELLSIVRNPGYGSLLGTHGNTVAIAVVAVVRVKLPALVDEIIIVGSVITDKVPILIRGVINTRRAKLIIIVHRIQIRHGILLRLLPILIRLIAKRIIVRGILTSKIQLAPLRKVIVSVRRHGVEGDTLGFRVESHLEHSPGEGLDGGVELVAVLVVAHAEAFVASHVLESGEGDNVFVFINGPQMLGNLLNVLIKFLPVHTNQFPIRVGRMTIQRTWGIVAKVFIVSSPGIVGVSVRSPHHPSGTGTSTFTTIVITAILGTTPPAVRAVNVAS